ncbi:hypothetical protein PRIPAC_78415 [Pristionchus pacificus]|uniref:G protein-coupled receptor n=1 Tax=Pristionchus pacificus TaxID=54126 RepID=A0A2A6CN65_PRIPA|nr:hypothetical protein PRIPAC_78415 [Pristionchus pacificus]|eukprot:PDM79642.1 G protein-coupled receptor [Pristionchus pacificus]
MANLSLHPIWHTLMPAHEHVVCLSTHTLSALAIYLIITKTPPLGRPFAKYLLLLQVLVTFVDFDFGFLFCPIPLYPAPGALCYGVLCTVFNASGHIGMLFLVFAFFYPLLIASTLCFWSFLTWLTPQSIPKPEGSAEIFTIM